MEHGIKALHNTKKLGASKEVTHFKNGRVIRKLEIATIIAQEVGVECIKVAAKNATVYAAVKTVDENGVAKVSARIYDTYVNACGSKTYLNYVMYTEDEFMTPLEYDDFKYQLDFAMNDEEKAIYQAAIDDDPRYVLPTGCHSSILKLLTPTANVNALAWRTACKETLDALSAEKLIPFSLHNLPLETRIMLNKEDENGNQIVLVKDNDPGYKSPVWVDEVTCKKYKIKEVQTIGFSILND